MKLVNLACGLRYHPDWVNIDFHSDSETVKQHNILEGLPFDDNEIDVIYSSHFLEHLFPEDAERFLVECFRVLRKKGVLRVVVPDLENICREYIKEIDINPYGFRRKWLIIELIDQIARNKSGGMLGDIYKNHSTLSEEDIEYIKTRVGKDLKTTMPNQYTKKRKITIQEFKRKFLYFYLVAVKHLIPKNIRKMVFNEASIGENHRWMYDFYELEMLLLKIGFSQMKKMAFNLSTIPDFNSFLLDINPDGTPYKGMSSLYVEAIK
jgi:predicted SAM-dependent methyltransferase